MTVKSIWLRRIHKCVGLVIGLQFLIWAISGTAMALLDMDEVAGGATNEQTVSAPQAHRRAWPRIQQALASQPISKLSTRALPSGQVYEVTTADGVKLFDAANGSRVLIDRAAALSIAGAAHPGRADVAQVLSLRSLPLAVREHELPIWQVDFQDEANSSYFISGTTGQILERRNDTWRWWDFFWMLHNMDYANRTSFNHPLIITVGFALSWLAVTGFWLLFRTMWRHDFIYLRKLPRTKLSANK